MKHNQSNNKVHCLLIIICALVNLVCSFSSIAQTFSPQVTPAAGGYAVAGNKNYSWTIGEIITPTMSIGNYKFSQGFQQPEVQVLTNNLGNVVCAGNTISVSYTAYGIIGSNNIFTAQLSDANGSFANPIAIGTATGNSSGIMNATIPLYTASGSAYRIRVVSSLPLFNGKKNPANITTNTPLFSNSSVTGLGCYTWNINGASYTASGTYIQHVPNAMGCDSVYILNLTVTNGINLTPKVFLAGPYNSTTNLMSDSLRINNLIPSTEPYSSSPFNKPQIGGAGGETITPEILAISGNNAIVDWVFIEVRNALNSSVIVATKRALLQRDGDIVSATDGVSPVFIAGLTPGNYYVSIKHRNHLGVMTNTALGLMPCGSAVDFTTASPVYTNNTLPNTPRKIIGAIYTLWPGDANNNKNIKYNGTNNDKDQILTTIGGSSFINNTLYGYRTEDANMDGKVRYNNTDNDRLIIINNLGVSTPNNVLYQHVPN